MKIAITGSNGFVGSYAVKYFSKEHEIIAFQRQKYEIQKILPTKNWTYEINTMILLTVIYLSTQQLILNMKNLNKKYKTNIKFWNI